MNGAPQSRLAGDGPAASEAFAGTEPRPRASERVRQLVRDRPFVAFASAFCVGFALGGGVSRGLITLLLGAGGRVLAARVGDSILEHASHVGTTREETV